MHYQYYHEMIIFISCTSIIIFYFHYRFHDYFSFIVFINVIRSSFFLTIQYVIDLHIILSMFIRLITIIIMSIIITLALFKSIVNYNT